MKQSMTTAEPTTKAFQFFGATYLLTSYLRTYTEMAPHSPRDSDIEFSELTVDVTSRDIGGMLWSWRPR